MEEINTYLMHLSNQLSFNTDVENRISVSYNYLKSKILEDFGNRIESVQIFGSYDRGTALSQTIDQDSDVDVMVIFREKEFQPVTLLKHLRQFAENIYPRSEVSPDHPAVTVILQHTKFELVPAYWERYFLMEDDLKIPAPKNIEQKWITTNPSDLKEQLEQKDRQENGMIKPLIRLMKYLNTLYGKPYPSFAFDYHAINHNYPKKQVMDYFFEFINDMYIEGQTAEQVTFIQELKTRRKNILYLIEGDMPDYAMLELIKLFKSDYNN